MHAGTVMHAVYVFQVSRQAFTPLVKYLQV